MLVFYIVSLALAAGLIGSHVRMLLAGLGFVPGFVASLYITLAGAAAYVALQLFMVALVRLYQPTRSPTTLTTEAVSNLASLVLLGTCFSEAIPLPSDRFRPLLPLAFLGLFAMLHAFLKLATFYAALQGARDDNRPILAWLGGGVLALMFAGAATLGWVTRIEAARGVISGDPEWTALGEEYAHAREANEGAVLSGAIPPNRFGGLGVRFGPTGDNPAGLDRVYATISVEGTEEKVYETSDRLYPDRWSEVIVPADALPTDPRRFTVRWTREPEPNWVRLLGLRPVVYRHPITEEGDPFLATLFLSGPTPYASPSTDEGLNILVLMIDGLGANHLSFYGYGREVTPAIDRLGYSAASFPSTYVPAKDTGTAIRALLSGADPARLDASDAAPALLRALEDAGFARGAFVETGLSEGFVAAEWAKGFELFDGANPRAIRDSAADDEDVVSTTGRATAWIRRHREVPFFCLVRLRSLADLETLPEAETVFMGAGDTVRDIDAYDNALLDLDRQVGALIRYVRDHETRDNTCIVVTAPYGHEFTPGSSGTAMGLRTERVPLLVFLPGSRQRTYSDRAGMHDLGVTLAGLAGVRLGSGATGVNLLE